MITSKSTFGFRTSTWLGAGCNRMRHSPRKASRTNRSCQQEKERSFFGAITPYLCLLHLTLPHSLLQSKLQLNTVVSSTQVIPELKGMASAMCSVSAPSFLSRQTDAPSSQLASVSGAQISQRISAGAPVSFARRSVAVRAATAVAPTVRYSFR